MKLFVDTWGWLTLRDRGEARHREVVDFYNHFHSQGGSVYTTDYVLDETFTLLFRRLPFSQAQESVEILEEAVMILTGDIHFTHVGMGLQIVP